jgi:hypothetical protein
MASPWRNPARLIQQIEQDLTDGKSVMVLAMCNYMLEPTLASLRKAGIPFGNEYRPANPAWNPLQWRGKGISTIERLLNYHRPQADTWGVCDSDPSHCYIVCGKHDCAWPGRECDAKCFTRCDTHSRFWTLQEWERVAEMLRVNAYSTPDDAKLLRTMIAGQEEIGMLGSLFVQDDLESYFSPESVARILAGDLDWLEDNALKTYQTRMQYLLAIMRKYGGQSLQQARQGQPSAVCVSTMTASKGGQRDRVYIYPDMSPIGAKKWQNIDTRPPAIRQGYVALTRARERVILMDPSGLEAMPWRIAQAS